MSVSEPFPFKLKMTHPLNSGMQKPKIVIPTPQNLIQSSQGAENVSFGAISENDPPPQFGHAESKNRNPDTPKSHPELSRSR